MADQFALVQHFKWHTGVERSVRDRLAFYKVNPWWTWLIGLQRKDQIPPLRVAAR